MAKTGWMEKRQHERVVATLKIDYRSVDAKDSKKVLEHAHYKQTTVNHLPELSKKSPLHHAVTKDISMGGLALLGTEPFTMGVLVEIGLQPSPVQNDLEIPRESCPRRILH